MIVCRGVSRVWGIGEVVFGGYVCSVFRVGKRGERDRVVRRGSLLMVFVLVGFKGVGKESRFNSREKLNGV